MSLIVILDDRATNRTIYSQLAKSISQDVVVKAFADPAEALVWLAGNRADLIVTDYDMPNIDGGEFILRFRNLPHGQTVPIIMLTVCEKRILRLRALESGANDFLNTPIDHHEFLMRARNLLQLSRAVAAQAPPGQEKMAPPGHVKMAPPGHEKKAPPGHVKMAPPGRKKMAPSVAAPDPAVHATARSGARRGAAKRAASIAIAMTEAHAEAAPARGVSTWRVAPIADLRAGFLAGGQLLREGALADASDAESLRAALDILARFGNGGPSPFRLSLRWDLAGVSPSAPLHLAAALAASGVAASRLDLRVSAASLDRLGRRAAENARALRLLGLGLTLELGDPSTRPAALGNKAFALAHCDRIALPAASLIAQIQPLSSFFAPLPMLILGVAAAADLRALRRLGVHFAQGECFGPALAPHDLPLVADGGPKSRVEKQARRA